MPHVRQNSRRLGCKNDHNYARLINTNDFDEDNISLGMWFYYCGSIFESVCSKDKHWIGLDYILIDQCLLIVSYT